jgi:hypothetical protein
VVTTIAGQPGNAVSDGIGLNAGFRNPIDVAVDYRRGCIIVADGNSPRIQTLTPLAGTTRLCVALRSVNMRLFVQNRVQSDVLLFNAVS